MKFRFLAFSMAVLPLLFSCEDELAEMEAVVPDEAVETELPETGDGYVPGVTYVEFSEEMAALVENDFAQGKVMTRSMPLNQVFDELGIVSVRRLFEDGGEFEPRMRRCGLHRWYVVEFDPEVSLTRASVELSSIPGIESVEQERMVECTAFNDPYLDQQWWLYNGKNGGVDVNVKDVWSSFSTGDPSVTVAVVDYGIDLKHADLAYNCGDEHYDFVTNDESIEPGGHGTHIAGIIAAVNNNAYGGCGIAGGDWKRSERGVTLMSCQTFKDVVGDDGKTSTKTAAGASAIVWAANHGAVICSNSWSYSYDSDHDGKLSEAEKARALAATISVTDRLAIDYFIEYAGCDNQGRQLKDSPMKGGLVVFAAGNNAIENGVPANYERVLAVASTTSSGSLASYSNYGAFVDLCAPGSSVYSTIPGGGYGLKSGTSMACPMVSGVAALVVSCYGGPGFTVNRLRSKLLGGSNKARAPRNAGGFIDALGAIYYGESSAPSKVQEVRFSCLRNTITLEWDAVSDRFGRPAGGYNVIYGGDREKVESATSDNASEMGLGVLRVDDPGEGTVKCKLTGLDFDSAFYVKVVGRSPSNDYGDPSDIVSVKTGSNHPPVFTPVSVEPLTLRCFESKTISFNAKDPDGDDVKLVYTGGSSADSFDQNYLGSPAVKISAAGNKSGSYRAVITAEDQFGAISTLEIDYTILKNMPPVATGVPENRLLSSPGEKFSIPLADFFNDPDGEPLSCSAVSSDPSVCYLSRTPSSVVGTIQGFGQATVTITVFDASRASAEVSFKVLVRDPSVEYQAYPNPVSSELNLALGLEEQEVELKLFSSAGGLSFSESRKGSAFDPARFDLSNCPAGRYKAKIRFGSKEFEQTIVKK